jgi:hypothetical protein
MTVSSVLRYPQAGLSHRRRPSPRLSVARPAVIHLHGPWVGIPFWALFLMEVSVLMGLAFAAGWGRDLLFVAMWGLLYAYFVLCRRGWL